jgi:glycosyltransferase involved in cell wall biosynthesis
MAALEALALGVPVIAPNFGAFPYAIKDGFNGLLFEPGSVDALASCLERVAREEGLVAQLRCGAMDAVTRPAAMQQSFSKAIDSAFASGSAPR